MAEPHHAFVSAGEHRFWVADWGYEGLPPLFLLHGLGSRLHMFDLIAPALTERFHVFAYDQRGHGLSDHPDDGYDFETVAGDLDQVAQALGVGDQPRIVVGHSWGAYAALYYAATRPAITRKAVLLDGGIRPLRDLFPTWAEGEIGLAPPAYVDMDLTAITALIRRWQGAGYREESAPLALTIFDQRDPHDIHAWLNRPNNMRIAYHLWQFQPTDYYARVTCPLLIVNAVEPGTTPSEQMRAYAQTALDRAGKAQVVWMQDTIHDIPWHRPDDLVTILKSFLAAL